MISDRYRDPANNFGSEPDPQHCFLVVWLPLNGPAWAKPLMLDRSDVWSFGISMIEIVTGKFPYQLWATPFDQLKQVSLELIILKPITYLPSEILNLANLRKGRNSIFDQEITYARSLTIWEFSETKFYFLFLISRVRKYCSYLRYLVFIQTGGDGSGSLSTSWQVLIRIWRLHIPMPAQGKNSVTSTPRIYLVFFFGGGEWEIVKSATVCSNVIEHWL